MSSAYTFRTPQIPVCSLRAKEIGFARTGFEANFANLFPPRSILDLLSLLDSGESEDFHLIEWVKLFNDLEGWAECAPLLTKRLVTSFLVQSMVPDAVRFMALSRLSEYIAGISGGLPEVVFDCLDAAKETAEGQGREGLVLLAALREKNYRVVVEHCFSKRVEPRKYFELNCIYFNWKNEEQLAGPLGCMAGEKYKAFSYVITCFNKMTDNSKIQVIESYLISNNNTKFEPAEMKWLDFYVKPFKGLYWDLISDFAKKILFSIYGQAGLDSLSFLLEIIGSENKSGSTDNSKVLPRIKFWMNYTDSIQRFKLIMNTINRDKYVDYLDGIDVLTFHDVSPQPMVLLLDLGGVIVSQYLGESFAEIRAFKKTSSVSDDFFEKIISNSNYFREFKFDGYSDHAFGWQHYAAKLLFEKFKISINKNVKYFKGLPEKAGKISSNKLIRPDAEYFTSRSKFLDNWIDQFWNREMINYPGQRFDLELEKYNLANLIISDPEPFKSEIITPFSFYQLLTKSSKAYKDLKGTVIRSKSGEIEIIERFSFCECYVSIGGRSVCKNNEFYLDHKYKDVEIIDKELIKNYHAMVREALN